VKPAFNWLLVSCAEGFNGLGWEPALLAAVCQGCRKMERKQKKAAERALKQERPGAPPLELPHEEADEAQAVLAQPAQQQPQETQPLPQVVQPATFPLELEEVWESARTQEALAACLKPAYAAPEPMRAAPPAPTLNGATHAPPIHNAEN
jgi:hypothetical protein